MRTLNGALVVDDPRNDLLLEILRFVDVLRPRAVMIENVPRLANDERFHVFRKLMEDAGYLGGQDVFNAADYGVPQPQAELIYLAGLGSRIPFAEPVPDKVTVKDAIGGLPRAGKSGDPIHDMLERRTPRVMQMIRRIPKDGGSRTDLPEEDQLDCHKRCNGFRDVYGRMAWSHVSPTITSGCFIPPRVGSSIQRRTVRSRCVRLRYFQGFPRQYKFPARSGKSAIAIMIGNALPPPFMLLMPEES